VKVRPWYKTANSKEGINFTEPYIEWETNKIVVSAIEALYDNDQPYGFIAVDFKLDTLPDVISQIDVGENGQIFIIDEYGTYMYHADATNVLTLSMKDEIGELYNYINQEDHISSTLNSIQVDGKNFYVFTQKLHYMDWSLVTLLDKNEVHKNLYNFIFYMSILTIVLSTIIIFSIVKIIQNKVAPISALKNYGSKIANGQLDEHPPYEYATRNDEMGDLARSFVTITEVFKQKNALLEEVVTSQYAEIQEQYHYILEKEKMASLGTLVAGVAHEINTPLGIGVTTSSYIEEIVKLLNTHFEEKTLSKTVLTQNLVSLIEASHILSVNLMRAADLVQQFKSIATNQNIEMLSSFNLCTEISNVIASLRPTFKHKKIMIQNDCLESILMSSYPGALTQIFTNLMMNSMFHGFEDDQEGLIHITASLDGELVRIMYSDNGKGIKKDDLDRIFEPFFTTRRKKGSSGLGMYITHNLTTQTLSGTISCESTIGNGVLFKILLPLHLKAEDPKEIE
jgi:methyl-accepting chemotaxis protein